MTHAAKASKLRLVNRIISYSGDPRSMTQTSDSGHWVKTRWQLTRRTMVLPQRRTMSGADSAGNSIMAQAVQVHDSHASAPQRTYPPRSAVWGWIFRLGRAAILHSDHDLVFAPYFASRVASDPVAGQSSWGYATAAAGLVIAMLSPVRRYRRCGGRRKPWIAVFGALLVIGSSLMWIGKPGDPSIIVPLLIAYAIATIGVEFATVFNNAMMPTLVPPERIGRLSGTGWATGYVGGILSLVLVLGFMAANPSTGKTLFGLTPILGLNPQNSKAIASPGR
jgi:UMF1 family MFS transporter